MTLSRLREDCVVSIFKACTGAIDRGTLIRRQGRRDKEFHFQNWFQNRLDEVGLSYDQPGRNTYPDFRLVHRAEGYEIKGLAYPGREADYDCNSQIPMGMHNGRSVYYVFGRYPNRPDGDMYPVLDLVICHGSFINADNTYTHRNSSFRGFGSYGDILVRDRKMYVAPTPFALALGTAHRRTLILPDEHPVPEKMVNVGRLERREVPISVVAYNFDLRSNELRTEVVRNPNADRVHAFYAWRLEDDPIEDVMLQEKSRGKFEQSVIFQQLPLVQE